MKFSKSLFLFGLLLALSPLSVSAQVQGILGSQQGIHNSTNVVYSPQVNSQSDEDIWKKTGQDVNNAFYFVVDKVIDLQGYFIWYAKGVGRVVFLIAICTAALNYALTVTRYAY
ncbi:MAG: hypothetical protein LBQ93_08950 [Treponema sp.]|jgi:hypothetical protein|nr:hypothetical protein [Treponema sp.]